MEDLRVELLQPTTASRACESVLRSVPEWFGIEDSTLAYIAAAGQLPTWVAFREGSPDAAGFVTIKKHFPAAADVYCMAVHRDHHGKGIGTAMLHHVENALRSKGVQYLQVKTMGPSKPGAEYARTLRFYLRVGFTPLEEVQGLWPGLPCLILVKRL